MSDEEEGEDWFERALREDGEEAADAAGTGDADGSAEDDDVDRPDDDGDHDAGDDPFGGDFDEDVGDIGEGPTGAGEAGAGDPEGSDPSEDPFGDGPAGEDGAPAPGDGDGFGGLDGNGGVAGGEGAAGGEFGGASDDADADPFGGASDDADADPFGGASDDAGEDPFGDDFGAAMRDAPGGGDVFGGGEGFGGGGGGDFGGFGGGGGGPEFDEEEFDSDIDRIDVGIEGLDEMILGGVPERSLMAVIGSAGTGKTTFGLQFLTEALEDDGDAVYITLEESREAILSTAEEKGWEYRRYAEEDRLAVVAMDPIEMANSLDSIRDDISRLITEFEADRLVLDSVSLLEMMYDHPSKRRSEVFDFARSLKQAGVTTMLTSEASQENAYASRHGIVEYLTDAVFVLQYVRPSDFRETRLAVEIQKIRDANHSRETKPYEITNDGISVYRQANIF
ncbi:KaiC domain-containing protein [Halobaculum sp. EA56]|uniref:KaiC domain-containing protein n=1 Tax=Halobaculum sp. EA56 TaxID=3421648 RepID=UPI003EBB43EA